MADEKIIVEVSAIVDDISDRLHHIFRFEVHFGIWNRMEQWERDQCIRRKLWKKLGCEYKVIEEKQP